MSIVKCFQTNKCLYSICNNKFLNCRSSFLTKYSQNSTSCAIGKQSRSTYPRMYKTIIALEDGSTIEVRCEHPRKLVQLPIDMTIRSDQERKELWLSRKTKVQHKEIDIEEDDYDSGTYRNLF